MEKRIKNFIGIDISKKTLDAVAFTLNSRKPVLQTKTDNNVTGFKSLTSKLRQKKIILNPETLVLFESMGFYQRPLLEFLIQHKSHICIESASRVKKSLGLQRGKKDSIDAERLARYAITHKETLQLWKNPRKILLTVADLLSNRSRIVKTRMMLESYLSSIKTFLKIRDIWLMKRINKSAIDGIVKSELLIETSLLSIVNADQDLKKQITILTSIPGIGFYTALYMIYFTNEFTTCNSGKQLASYCGVVPFEHSSGSSMKGKPHVSYMCNHTLKRLLHLGALANVARKKGELYRYYERKVAEGKPKGLVLNALKNKLVLRAYAMIKSERLFQEEYPTQPRTVDGLSYPLLDITVKKRRTKYARVKKALDAHQKYGSGRISVVMR
jgi:transposase